MIRQRVSLSFIILVYFWHLIFRRWTSNLWVIISSTRWNHMWIKFRINFISLVLTTYLNVNCRRQNWFELLFVLVSHSIICLSLVLNYVNILFCSLLCHFVLLRSCRFRSYSAVSLLFNFNWFESNFRMRHLIFIITRSLLDSFQVGLWPRLTI